jgi:hypothetical protein
MMQDIEPLFSSDKTKSDAKKLNKSVQNNIADETIEYINEYTDTLTTWVNFIKALKYILVASL